MSRIFLLSLGWALLLASGCNAHKSAPKAGTDALLLPTPEPRPDFIGEVSPPESSVIPLSVYRFNIDEQMIHEGVRSEDMGFANSICVAIDTGPVLEDGDDLTNPRDVLRRLSIEVDSTPLTTMVYTMHYDILAYTEARDAEGMGWVVYCWQADLGAEKHEVIVRFTQTSGNIQAYKWYFAITP